MSSFYKNFPKFIFNNNVLTDLSVRIKIRDTWLNDESLYYRYIYKDSDKPEHIALKYYGDETLHWIFLLTNTIFDHQYDFPMSTDIFNKYITDKYKDNYGIKTLRILEHGSGYTDGTYEKVPIVSTSSTDNGKDCSVDLRIVDGKISNIEIYKCGSGYNENSILTISPDVLQFSSQGKQATFSIINFADGFTYALLTPDPVYRFQKQVKISSGTNVPQFYNYVIDEDSYYNLYDDYPSEVKELVIDDEVVTYEVSRRTPEVTIYNREFEVNESKRLVRVLKKEYITAARNELLNLVSS